MLNIVGHFLSDAISEKVHGNGNASCEKINYITGHAVFEATHGTAQKYPNQDKVDPIYFFFSSRRRHTRSKRDWSSDVCSSDLVEDIELRELADRSCIETEARLEVVIIVALYRKHGKPQVPQALRRGHDVSCRERNVLNAGAQVALQKSRRQGLGARRSVQRDSQRPIRRLNGLAVHESERVRDLELRSLRYLEEGDVVQKPREHFLVLHGLGDVINAQQPGIVAGALLRERYELVIPYFALVARLHEVDEAPAYSMDRGHLQFCQPQWVREFADLQTSCPKHRFLQPLNAQSDSAHRCTVNVVVGAREAFRLAVDDKVDVLLPPTCHALAAVFSDLGETQGREHAAEVDSLGFVGGKLDKLDAPAYDPGRKL